MSLFRNQYDNDVSVWSPQGRIHQIEYAKEAVKQGSAAVGLKSKTHAVLVAVKRSFSELSAYQKKIHLIDNHIGIVLAGLSSDGRLLSKFMRTECLNSKYAYNRRLPVSRLVDAVGNKMQYQTQVYGHRPYGVGLLVAGYDESGPHIYETCPSANYFDCKAMAIGSRSQSGRTYLERKLHEFSDCTLEQLIHHGLRALRETLPSETELSTKNCSIGYVGKDDDFTVLDDDAVEPHLSTLEEKEREHTAEEMADADAVAESVDTAPTEEMHMAEGEDEPAAADQMDVLQ
ncbi:proteasome subunit alpha type-1-like [Corticium candelabrum]|uniref:proteasome subunit alpha type-1-like n=1 Tax=Corticium candelabrum TaxID=121492 RepID=UPI002E266ACE|nr:proteasome subunit alpha type-1-like [Corticium candelabrum]